MTGNRQKLPEQSTNRVSSRHPLDDPETGFEEWAPIPSVPNYEASNTGKIRRIGGAKCRALRKDKSGYWSVSLPRPGGKTPYPYRVHVLVAEAFVGPRPADMHIDHLDGDKGNNHATNLEYVTSGENTRRAEDMGLINHAKGSGCARAKLTEAQVSKIKTALKTKSCAEVAAIYGVGFSSIWHIAKGKTWTHVQAA